MSSNVEAGLLSLLITGIVAALWFFFVTRRKKKEEVEAQEGKKDKEEREEETEGTKQPSSVTVKIDSSQTCLRANRQRNL